MTPVCPEPWQEQIRAVVCDSPSAGSQSRTGKFLRISCQAFPGQTTCRLAPWPNKQRDRMHKRRGASPESQGKGSMSQACSSVLRSPGPPSAIQVVERRDSARSKERALISRRRRQHPRWGPNARLASRFLFDWGKPYVALCL